MTTFEIPTVSTERLWLRAFRASDLDAYATMQAKPEVMRYMVMGRTSTPAEVWRTMHMAIGSWALRGYGMWACARIDGDGFFHPLDWPEPGPGPSVNNFRAPDIGQLKMSGLALIRAPGQLACRCCARPENRGRQARYAAADALRSEPGGESRERLSRFYRGSHRAPGRRACDAVS